MRWCSCWPMLSSPNSSPNLVAQCPLFRELTLCNADREKSAKSLRAKKTKHADMREILRRPAGHGGDPERYCYLSAMITKSFQRLMRSGSLANPAGSVTPRKVVPGRVRRLSRRVRGQAEKNSTRPCSASRVRCRRCDCARRPPSRQAAPGSSCARVAALRLAPRSIPTWRSFASS